MTEEVQIEVPESPLLLIMIDTCVWLDLAKDYRQRATIGALEELIRAKVVKLLLPRQVVDEFMRNKERIIKESGQSLASTFRRVREAVQQFGSQEGRDEALAQLSDVDHRIATLGEAVNESVGRIEALFAAADKIETCDSALLAAAQRALDKQAPFHKSKNSMGDAILIELYAKMLADDEDESNVFAFVTHNKHDFSSSSGDERLPHPDLNPMFDGNRSVYSINLNTLLNEAAPEWLEELQAEYEYEEEPRRLSELLAAERKLFLQVWYNRHWNSRIAIEEGRLKVLSKEHYSREPYKADEVLDTVWAKALEAAKRTEEELGADHLGPWDDFEWGVINGKLSAIRWVLGDEWDMLDT